MTFKQFRLDSQLMYVKVVMKVSNKYIMIQALVHAWSLSSGIHHQFAILDLEWNTHVC